MNPRLGCGAAIFDTDGNLLLVRRLREPEAGCWGLPGGKVEWLEETQVAVRREVREELGVAIELTGLICISELIDTTHALHWIAPVYGAKIISGEPRLLKPQALSAVDWFSLDQLPEPLTIATRQMLENLQRSSLAATTG